MDFKSQLLEHRDKVNLELEAYFKKKIVAYEGISEFASKFIRDLAEFTLRGGKRLRPALMYHAYKLFGGENDEELIKISCFLELLQSYLLIHDDIMDRSSLRRGRATIHKIYEKFSEEQSLQDDEHFGCSMAILSGDLASHLALEIVTDADFPHENLTRLNNLVSHEISKTYFGQIHDILLTYNYPKNYKEDDVLKMEYYKTGIYTFRLPLLSGAILAGAEEEDFDKIHKYAAPCGVAFQIRDDILGVFGKSKKTGQETKSDLIEGKKTLLVTEAYKNCDDAQRVILDDYIGKKDLTNAEADELRQVFKDTGALDYANQKCEELIGEAREALVQLDHEVTEAYDFLNGILDFLLKREG
jgi:geranylgeranyl diphosphate synthase type I